MLNTQFIKSLTDLRSDPAHIAKLAQESENPVYILNRGKPVSVLLDVKAYEELIEKLEDALDSLEMKTFEKKTRKEKWITHDELKKKLKIS
jgi:prevent-host-death family protein